MKKPKLDTEISGIQNQVNKKKDFRPPTTESSNILARLNLSMPKPEFLRSNSVQDADTSLTSSVSLMGSLGPRDPRKRKISRTTSMISPSPTSSDKLVIHSKNSFYRGLALDVPWSCTSILCFCCVQSNRNVDKFSYI